MKLFRTDTTRLDKVERTPAGGVRIPATLTKSGVFTYYTADGHEVREYRPPEEVARADSLASLRDAPITVGHPAVMVSPMNWKQLSVGHVSGEPKPTEAGVQAPVVVHDAETIRKIDARELQEISCGYEVELDNTPGVTADGQRYDRIQRQISYNHVALGPAGWGRQGSDVALRLDSAGHQNTLPQVMICSAGSNMKIKIRCDGKEHDVEAGTAEHLQLQARADAERDAALADANKRAELATARADAAEAENKKLKDELEAAPAKIAAAMSARATLEASARKVLGPETKFDGKSDRDIRLAVIAKCDSAFIAEGKSDDYVAARFDAELSRVPAQPATEIAAQLNTGAAAAGQKPFDYEAAVAKSRKDAADLWKPKPASN